MNKLWQWFKNQPEDLKALMFIDAFCWIGVIVMTILHFI